MPTPQNDLRARFGNDAVRRLAGLVGVPPSGDAAVAPASRSRCRSALVGAALGENLFRTSPRQLADLLAGHRRLGPAALGPDTRMALITADSVLSGGSDHPVRFAARLAAANVRHVGEAGVTTQRLLRQGHPWWDVAAGNSAGTAAAARSVAFGLLWSRDPEWAAYEAALSASVTHGHAEAIAGAAGMAAAIALAAQGAGALGKSWLGAVADVCDQYPQDAVYGRTVAQMIRRAGSLLRTPLEEAVAKIGTDPLATQAVPAALLWAAAARPFDWRDEADAWTQLRVLAGCHSAIGTMAGACLGARYGDQIWPVLERVGRTNGVVRTADRIAGKRVRPVRRQRRKRADGDKPPVHVSFLIDRSGSMNGMETAVVEGFNGFVADQREVEGECALTLVQFDSEDPYDVLIDAAPLAKVTEITEDQYRPRGGTPLLDALGSVIENADARLDEGRDEDQIVVIFTDGHENASVGWTRELIVSAVEERQEQGWTFVFLGAGLDSYAQAHRLGLKDHSVQDMAFDPVGMKAGWGSVGRATRDYRKADFLSRVEASHSRFFGRKEAEEDLLRRKGQLRQADEAARRRAEERQRAKNRRRAERRQRAEADHNAQAQQGGGSETEGNGSAKEDASAGEK